MKVNSCLKVNCAPSLSTQHHLKKFRVRLLQYIGAIAFVNAAPTVLKQLARRIFY